MTRKKVLIFPAGTEIAFEIVNALKYSKFVELYGGTSAEDHSEYIYKNLITDFPYVEDRGFLEYLNSKIHEYGIDCVYPAHDSVSLFLSKHADSIDAQVIITEYETTRICRSKKETYSHLSDCDYIPEVYEMATVEGHFPVFVKPDMGQGSVGAKTVGDLSELREEIGKDSSLVICELLQGKEYTIDCFTDGYGNLRCTQCRERARVRTGISVRSISVPLEETVLRIAQSLNSRLHFKGAWFFQLKKNLEGEYKLLEVSPRIPGTMGVSRNLGINFPMLTLFTFWGYSVEILKNEYEIAADRAFYSAYKIDCVYKHVYIDYDDTMVINDKINVDAIRFIYQALNQGKKIHLLSRHIGNIDEDLLRFRLCRDIFDEIVIVGKGESKANYIYEKEAIFIDDSFAERKNVSEKRGIPVFDVDMIECLLDWKV